MSNSSTPSACGTRLTPARDDHDLSSVKCGPKTAEFYPCKFKRIGNCLSKCIKHGNNWYNPNEFEALAGLHQTKKWKQSIKCGGKPLGEWLSEHHYDSGPDSSQECAWQQGNPQTKKKASPVIDNDSSPGNPQEGAPQQGNYETKKRSAGDTSECSNLNSSLEDANGTLSARQRRLMMQSKL